MKNSILRLLLSKGTFLLILFVILLLSSITAQEQFKRNELVVISPNGLNMRAEPYTRGKLMRKLPYGAKVGILEKLTKTEFTLTHEYEYYDKEGQLIHSDPLKGYWVKVTYEGIDGYAFSPFLAPVYDRENQFEGNENYVLLFEQTNCFNNIQIKKGWHWYGMFKKGDQFTLKKIQPSFYVIDWKSSFPTYEVCSNEKEYCYFILGAKNSIPYENRRTLEAARSEELCFYEQMDKNIWNEELKALGMYKKYIRKEIPRNALYLTSSNTEDQCLNPEAYNFFPPNCFNWVGDIDGDSERDYIITYGSKKSEVVLYLSSEKEENEIVAPASIYYNGYCCSQI